MSWYRKCLFEHHINVIIAVPELCLGMHKNKCWHKWVMLVSSLSNQLPYFAVPDCKAWHVRRARPRCASLFGKARLACASTFSLHAWRGNEKYLLFEKYLLDKQLSAIPLKSGQQILKLCQSMKSCSTTHNKHRGSRSYLCSVRLQQTMSGQCPQFRPMRAISRRCFWESECCACVFPWHAS